MAVPAIVVYKYSKTSEKTKEIRNVIVRRYRVIGVEWETAFGFFFTLLFFFFFSPRGKKYYYLFRTIAIVPQNRPVS